LPSPCYLDLNKTPNETNKDHIKTLKTQNIVIAHQCIHVITMAHIACTFYSNSTKGVEVAFASQSHKDTKFFPHLVGSWVRGKQNNPI
jgi:hypothetical protein